jgi:hypothetical protein
LLFEFTEEIIYMALTICPECAHEVSSTATACPNCGHPFVRPTVQPRVIVNELPPERDGFPTWGFIPLGILGIVLLFVFLVWMRNSGDDEAQRNINVRIASQQPLNTSRDSTVRTDITPNQVVVPSTSQPSTVVVPPSTSTSSVPSTTTTIPSTETAVAPDKGTVSLEAKVLSKNSTTPQPVRGTRFYLLKKDVETVLNSADIENDTGQSLLTAVGMSIVYPDRYGDISRKAMSAISKNAAYNITTDSSGKASLKDIKPDSYYLFAVTKSGNGFVLWNSPITIQAGQNALVLPPASPTEISSQEE